MSSKSDEDDDHQHNCGYRPSDEMSQNLAKVCWSGNFFVLGAIWIELMKKIMVGKRTCVVPKIYNNKNIITNAKQEDIVRRSSETQEAYSDKACKKKHVDIPFEHDSSRMVTHQRPEESDAKWYIYSSVIKDKWYTGKTDDIQKCLLPYVKNTRMNILEKWKGGNKYISDTLYASKCNTKNKILEVKNHIVDPRNCVKEKVCVSLSVATGVIIGSRKGYGRAIFNGGLGALASGMFCLRKKTEEFFRNILLRSMAPDDRRNSKLTQEEW